ncbi:hypothetical protein JXJ21_20525 [candidate division KSB1 bacterium]|nr:hypothetical protein [candidate division KSB1 bacterium]
MLSLFNIWIIARYEMKIVLRSWFFRIFSIIAILILTFLNVLNISAISELIVRSPVSSILKVIPSSLPYINLKLLNVVQTIIAIFIASDFLKRDRKLNTTEVIYARSMTNADYVLGKTTGIMLVFLGLNVIVLLIAAITQFFIPDLNLGFVPYLAYLLLISLPTLLFIIGLAYLLMSLIRSQAGTFILLLVYAGIFLIWGGTMRFLFDYLAYRLPMLYSDFVGFAGLDNIIFQRMMYLFFGLSFVFFTIVRMKRLIQSKAMNKLSLVLSILFLVLALFSGYKHLDYYNTIEETRIAQRQLNKTYKAHPRVQMLKCDLKLDHTGSQIAAEANLKFINNTREPIESYLFCLNPGLEVSKITGGTVELTFNRTQHILLVKPTTALAAGSTDSLTISYSGSIDEPGAFLEVEQEDIEAVYEYMFAFLKFNIKKQISFVTNNYVLLTPEVLWYPIAGLPYGANYPVLGAKDFIDFDLTVSTKKNLTAISQGAATKKDLADKAQFHFKPEHPLPQFSVAIGAYEQREITVDSVTYALWTAPGHDYFVPFMDELGDTLGIIIRNFKQQYEDYIGIPYPFKRFTLLEVPIQFCTYARPWVKAHETMQPEMALIAEQGVFCEATEFEMMMYWMERRQQRRDMTMTPQELQSDLLSRFIETNFIGGFSGRRAFGRRMGFSIHNYHIFPNYYTFINHLESKQWPIFNLALESSIRNRKSESQPSFFRTIAGLSDEEKCNLALRGNSLHDALLDSTQKDLFVSLIENKGKALFVQLQTEFGDAEFNVFLNSYLEQHRYQNATMTDFTNAMQKKFNFEFQPLFEEWYNGKALPGFLLTDVENYSVTDGDRKRSQVKFTVENPESVDGYLNLQFWLRGQDDRRMRFGPPSPDFDMNLKVEARQKKEVGILLDDDLRGFNIDTYVSQNIPSAFNFRFRGDREQKEVRPFEGERILPLTEEQATGKLEIIVDNEDPGFEIISKQQKNWLQKLFGSEDEKQDPYVGYEFWRLPGQWTPTANAKFYGKYVHSGYFIKSGTGDKKVAWTAKIPVAGNYEVYAYYEKEETFRFRRGRGRGDDNDKIGELNFIIHHDDGETEFALDRDQAVDGWNYMDSFYYSEGEAKIILTDKSAGRSVFADAVKWVKK